MPAGRPTLYTQDLLDKCYYYLDNWESINDQVFPSHVGLFIFVGISKTCAYRWAEDQKKKEFRDILDKCNALSEHTLLNGSLKGKLNANISKLVLGKHGYKESKESALTGPDGGPVEIDQNWTVEFVNVPDE